MGSAGPQSWLQTRDRSPITGNWGAVQLDPIRFKVLRLLTDLRIRAEPEGSRPIADPRSSNEMIRATVAEGRAAAIGKIGATELRALLEALAIRRGRHALVQRVVIEELHVGAGVFPPRQATLLRFADEFLEVARRMDLLAAWSRLGEREVLEGHCPAAALIGLRGLDPFYVERPWTGALAGKAVLVASPFVDTIGRQYGRRQLIWRDRPLMLPGFELQLMRLPLSDRLVRSSFEDWFGARDALAADLRSRRFDVLLVGGGAFSLPLVVAAREMGRIGIHLGGSTQVLFGVRGARWDRHPIISTFFNEHWVRPSPAETPPDYRQVEGGAYW